MELTVISVVARFKNYCIYLYEVDLKNFSFFMPT